VRFGLGAVAPTPLLACDQIGALSIRDSNPAVQEAAFQRLASQATPISDIRASKEYRQAMLVILMRKAWQMARQRLQGL